MQGLNPNPCVARHRNPFSLGGDSVSENKQCATPPRRNLTPRPITECPEMRALLAVAEARRAAGDEMDFLAQLVKDEVPEEEVDLVRSPWLER